MLVQLAQVYAATSRYYDAQATLNNVRETQYQLMANPFAYPPEQLARFGKALDLQAEQAKVMFAVSQAMREEAQARLKADLDLQKKLSQSWNS